MLNFTIKIDTSQPAAEQVVRAVKRAVVSGQLRAGDPFPSVRELSKSLKINPKTVQKSVAFLVGEGVLETLPNLGTKVSSGWEAKQGEKSILLKDEMKKLVVDAMLCGLDWEQFTKELELEWKKIK